MFNPLCFLTLDTTWQASSSSCFSSSMDCALKLWATMKLLSCFCQILVLSLRKSSKCNACHKVEAHDRAGFFLIFQKHGNLWRERTHFTIRNKASDNLTCCTEIHTPISLGNLTAQYQWPDKCIRMKFSHDSLESRIITGAVMLHA